MGQSADARLIYGFDGADTENDHYAHDWLRRFIEQRDPDGDHDPDELISLALEAAGIEGVQVHHYSWEYTCYAIGVSLMRAVDYGSESMLPEVMLQTIADTRDRLAKAAEVLGAPPTAAREPKLIVLASYA